MNIGVALQLAEEFQDIPSDNDLSESDSVIAVAPGRNPTSTKLLQAAVDRAISVGDSDEAHSLLTQLARSDDGLATVRRVWQARQKLPSAPGMPVRIALLSSFTLETLLPYVDVECRALGLVPDVYVAPFNSWTQEILDDRSELYRAEPEIAFLSVAIDDLAPQLSGAPSSAELEELGDMALERVVGAARQFVARSAAALVVHGFHSAFRDPYGVLAGREAVSRVEWLASLNARLASEVKQLPRAYLLDVAEVLFFRAVGSVDNPKMRHMAALRLGERVVAEVARAYARYIAPLKGLTRKCIVLDLDNTLWGGVIGEDGIHGIKLGNTSPGSEFREFQHYLSTLSKRGFLLAINSKNNPDDALEALRSHEAMLLREDAFSAVKINWSSKPENMRSIADELNIGLDSLVFVDDNPNERELMRQALPQVLTPEMPADPALYRGTLEALPQLQTLVITEEDRTRAAQYRSRRQRDQIRTTVASLDEYLHSLRIRVEILKASEPLLPRVHQLFQRTNQFNLTTRRHQLGELAAFSTSADWVLYAVKVSDRFGDHGLVATALVRADPDAWKVDSLLMSCRVIGYGVETALIALIAQEAREAGAVALHGEFIPTKKNAPARDFYERHGFAAAESAPDHSRWTHDLTRSSLTVPDWVELTTEVAVASDT